MILWVSVINHPQYRRLGVEKSFQINASFNILENQISVFTVNILTPCVVKAILQILITVLSMSVMSSMCHENGKQCRLWSNCSLRSSLIRVYTVCWGFCVCRIQVCTSYLNTTVWVSTPCVKIWLMPEPIQRVYTSIGSSIIQKGILMHLGTWNTQTLQNVSAHWSETLIYMSPYISLQVRCQVIIFFSMSKEFSPEVFLLDDPNSEDVLLFCHVAWIVWISLLNMGHKAWPFFFSTPYMYIP